VNDIPPWRRPPRDHFPGVPAWGAPVSAFGGDRFDVSRLATVTPEWAWGGADGSGVRVCLLDSGVDATHPLVGGIDRAMDVAADADGGLAIIEAEPGDSAGHGTACASVIRSVAPGASLTSVRVLGSGTYGTGSALLAGLSWAVDEGFDVINMSLSTTKAKFCTDLQELADKAYFRRCLLVASAHNMPVQSYPWRFASVISVASHDGPDPMTYYYNPSPPVEFYARGVRVPVAWPGGRRILSTGNSFATPHIAGITALILSKHPMLTPFQLKSALYLAASNVAQT
jgi:subtilisin